MSSLTNNSEVGKSIEQDLDNFTFKDISRPGKVFFGMLLLYFLLNFAFSPMLKYLILPIYLLTAFLQIRGDKNEAFFALVGLILIEGQGRVLWGYNPFFRIGFDLMAGLRILRTFIDHKKIIPVKILPTVFLTFIFAHFFWFLLELSNPMGAGVFAGLATAKTYIFPFFLFFTFILDPVDLSSSKSKYFIKIVTFFLLTLAILSVYQLSHGTEGMNKISVQFTNLFKKFANFTGEKFRPWGTSHKMGSYSQFFYLMAGFVFLFFSHSKKKVRDYGIFSLILAIILGSLFVGQVRSSLVKFLGICLIIGFLIPLGDRRHLKYFSKSIFVFIFLGILGLNMATLSDKYELNLENSINRIAVLFDKDFSTKRVTLGQAFDIVEERFVFPLGLGLGMTTNSLPDFQSKRILLKNNSQAFYFSFDNLYVYLAMELGIGALFYYSIIIGGLLYLGFSMLSLASQEIRDFNLSVLKISFSTILMILIGNWGREGIPYNPESFFFWFWMSQGILAFKNALEQRKV